MRRLGGRLQFEEGICQTVALACPAHESAQEHEAPVVGGRGWASAPSVCVQVIDQCLLYEQLGGAIRVLSPREQVVDRHAVGVQAARAALRTLETSKPRVALTVERSARRAQDERPAFELLLGSLAELGVRATPPVRSPL